jgi:hypothetical protein
MVDFMTTIKNLLFLFGDIVLIGGPALYIYMCLWKPTELVLFNADKRVSELLRYALFLTSLAGVGVVMYVGISFLFSWMPHSWGGYIEDTYIALSDFIAFMCALSGSISVHVRLEQNALDIDDLEIRTEALGRSFEHIKHNIACLSLACSSDYDKDLGKTLDRLEQMSAELQRPIERERIKNKNLPALVNDIPLRYSHYHVDLEPTLKLIAIMRRTLRLSNRSPTNST